ncbi:MAG: sulfatase-like hydrolase/transferase [Chlamydiales bacterium]
MRRINYLYFSIYFLLLVLLCTSSIFTKDSFNGSRFFFFLYAVGQSALETIFLVLIGYTLQYFTNRKIFLTYIGATFLLFILHILNFLMERILDLSIWDTISFVLAETFSNFIFLLDASGIPLWAWTLFFAAFAMLPLLGIAFYKITEHIIKRRHFSFSYEAIPLIAFCVVSGLLSWDFSASRVIHPNTYTAFIQSLPWQFTFLQPKTVILKPSALLSSPPNEKQTLSAVYKEQTSLSAKPNIYLFVIESFRDDFITEAVAPNLFAFKKSCVPIETTLSNANGTHLSWYSLFHSQFSYNWHLVQQSGWSAGSASLLFLKNLGYHIHLYTSAQLGYYGMENLLFGQENYLLASSQKFPHNSSVPASETDADALRALLKDLKEQKSLQNGQIFLTFWDSTHFDYSWPKTWIPKFTPFANTTSYFSTFYSEECLNKIKNRYRNAVNYIDHLFGEFLQNIPNQEEAIIIVLGDHGEEFFEKGHLFHCSHLAKEQTRVPILMYFGGKTLPEKRMLLSQMDVFPSIIDYLTGKTPSFLQGQSVFRENRKPYVVISRFNAGRTPYEFCLHNGKNKMIGQFVNRGNILESTAIKIISLQTSDDKNLSEPYSDVHSWTMKEFGPAIDRLFH